MSDDSVENIPGDSSEKVPGGSGLDSSVNERVRLGAARAVGTAVRSLGSGLGLIRESTICMFGFGIVLFWILVALLAPLIAPYAPTEQHPEMILALPEVGEIIASLWQEPKPPDEMLYASESQMVYWLGGDALGRDVLSRMIWGTRTVLLYSLVATFCAYLIGVLLGLLAGYKRGIVDDILSRVSDIILSFPIMVLYLVIITAFGPSGINIVLAVTFASAPGIMRIVRGLTLDLRNRDYIAAAQTRGESAWYIMFVEILPNARGPLIVDACLRVGYVIITIGVLGFLGIGLPPPSPDWGSMINDGRQYALSLDLSYLVVLPSIAISSLVLGCNLLADGLREIALND